VLPLVYASQVHVGKCIMTVSGEERVSAVETVQGEGVYTAVTQEEFIVVNGIIASPFGANHMMANLYYNMHRFLYTLSPVLLSSNLLHAVNEGLGMATPLFGST
jgi:Hint module